MYKTAVYWLVNGGITHQRQQISENMILRSNTSPKCQCTAAQYHLANLRVPYGKTTEYFRWSRSLQTCPLYRHRSVDHELMSYSSVAKRRWGWL